MNTYHYWRNIIRKAVCAEGLPGDTMKVISLTAFLVVVSIKVLVQKFLERTQDASVSRFHCPTCKYDFPDWTPTTCVRQITSSHRAEVKVVKLTVSLTAFKCHALNVGTCIKDLSCHWCVCMATDANYYEIESNLPKIGGHEEGICYSSNGYAGNICQHFEFDCSDGFTVLDICEYGVASVFKGMAIMYLFLRIFWPQLWDWPTWLSFQPLLQWRHMLIRYWSKAITVHVDSTCQSNLRCTSNQFSQILAMTFRSLQWNS